MLYPRLDTLKSHLDMHHECLARVIPPRNESYADVLLSSFGYSTILPSLPRRRERGQRPAPPPPLSCSAINHLRPGPVGDHDFQQRTSATIKSSQIARRSRFVIGQSESAKPPTRLPPLPTGRKTASAKSAARTNPATSTDVSQSRAPNSAPKSANERPARMQMHVARIESHPRAQPLAG